MHVYVKYYWYSSILDAAYISTMYVITLITFFWLLPLHFHSLFEKLAVKML